MCNGSAINGTSFYFYFAVYICTRYNQNQNMQCMTTDYTYTGGSVLRDSPRRELRTESVSVQVSQVWSRLPTEALALQ